MAPSPGEKYPEILAEVIWEELIKKLFQKDYHFDVSFYGSLNEYSRKVAYFFHASLQGTGCYDGAGQAIEHVKNAGVEQGLLGNGQLFTTLQLQRGLTRQGSSVNLDLVLAPEWCFLSHRSGGRKPSERFFRALLSELTSHGIEPHQVLHVGNNMDQDLIPAKKLGMRTALVAHDKSTLTAGKDQLKDPACRPDILMTELQQIALAISAE
jgi:FMN phosphatase YigB (HAD superfamily)